MSDSLADGRIIRTFNVDDYNREGLSLIWIYPCQQGELFNH